MRAYQTGIKDFGTTKYGNRKLDYMKRGIVVGSVKICYWHLVAACLVLP